MLDSGFRNEFQEFMYSNSIIVSAAGWAVGVATKEFIQSFLEKSLIPIFIWLGNILLLPNIKQWVIKNTKVLTYFTDLLWTFLFWVLTIIFTFIILEYVFNRNIVGMKTKIKDEEQDEFNKSKIELI